MLARSGLVGDKQGKGGVGLREREKGGGGRVGLDARGLKSEEEGWGWLGGGMMGGRFDRVHLDHRVYSVNFRVRLATLLEI
ncbi:unnamed protein product [Prunus armeniaca]